MINNNNNNNIKNHSMVGNSKKKDSIVGSKDIGLSSGLLSNSSSPAGNNPTYWAEQALQNENSQSINEVFTIDPPNLIRDHKVPCLPACLPAYFRKPDDCFFMFLVLLLASSLTIPALRKMDAKGNCKLLSCLFLSFFLSLSLSFLHLLFCYHTKSLPSSPRLSSPLPFPIPCLEIPYCTYLACLNAFALLVFFGILGVRGYLLPYVAS